MSEDALNLVQVLLDERAALNGERKLPSEGQKQVVALESAGKAGQTQTRQVSLRSLNGNETRRT